uniref:ZP domain-containing protein n=1 Tax=Plectus sambesii TaxID=2011161 RepID=A0A914UN21_9BILA
MIFILVLLSAVISLSSASTIDNGVIGDPEIECSSDKVLINFNTQKEFEGHVFVKGHYGDSGCRVDATLQRSASLSVPFDSCDVRRQRSSNPKGLFVSVTVVITFHPMFITMVDKAYNVQCFYMETEKTVTAGLDVSLGLEQQQKIVIMIGGKSGDMEQLTGQLRKNKTLDDINSLQTEVITQNIPMPSCRYLVLDGSATGAPVKFATVGQQVYHKWTCEDENGNDAAGGVYCATVHSCKVADHGGKEVQLLDENGCAVDKFLLNNLEYSSELTGGQTSMVFKFADQPTLFFQCQIRLTLKEGDKCKRSSDACPVPVRGKRDAEQEQTEEGEDVDVFSQSMTVFELDDPINAKLDEMEVQQLNRAVSQHEEVAAIRAKAMCLSPVTFGLLVAVLVSVLLISLITVAVLCLRSRSSGKVHTVSQ